MKIGMDSKLLHLLYLVLALALVWHSPLAGACWKASNRWGESENVLSAIEWRR